MKQILAGILAVSFILSACTTPTPTTTKQPAPTSAPTVTLTPNPAGAAASTPLPTATRPAIVGLRSLQESPTLQVHCLDVKPAALTDLHLEGSLLLGDRNPWVPRYLQDLTDGSQIVINDPGYFVSSISVSPDASSFAFDLQRLNQDKNQILESHLIVMSPQGEKMVELPWQQNWTHRSHLVGSNRFLAEVFEPAPPDEQMPDAPGTEEKYPFDGLLLDLISGNTVPLPSNYPSILKEKEFITEFNPQVTHVIYNDTNPTEGSGYRVYDLERKQVIADIRSDSFGNVFNRPVWSADGTKFAVAMSRNGYGLFSIRADGSEIVKYADWVEQFPSLDIAGYNWSPDGRYLALYPAFEAGDQSQSANNHESQLAVIDTQTNLTTFYCLQVDYGGGQAGWYSQIHQPPVWSPDSTKLIFENRYDLEESRLILVDLSKEKAFEIAKNTMIYGWLK